MRKKVVILGTGGTISGRALAAMDNVGYTAAEVPVSDLLATDPWLERAFPSTDLVAEQVAQIDSKDLDCGEWFRLAHRALHWMSQPEVCGLVVTHGTDTVEETAFFLSAVLPVHILESKPVVLTGAMRPVTSVIADGPQNLRDALTVCCAEGANGVSVACAARLHDARLVQKIHPYRADAFDSGESGPLGVVEEGVLRMLRPWPRAGEFYNLCAIDRLLPRDWPRVEIIVSGAAMSGATVRSLCRDPISPDQPVQGIVVAATGNGTIHHDLESALLFAQSRGVRVVRALRCLLGRVVQREGIQALFPHSNGLSPAKSRVALMLELMASASATVPPAGTAFTN
jgi:L-asparaginase